MGDLTQCLFVKSLINDCIYQNQRITVSIEENDDLEWKVFLESYKNKMEKNTCFQLKNSNNRNFFKPKNNTYYQGNNNIHFPGKIYKPFWQNQKINDSQLYTNSRFKRQSPHYFTYNQKVDFQKIPSQQNSFLEKFQDFSAHNHIPPGLMNFVSKNEQTINESKTGNEEEKKRILKEKLLNMFKNINQNNFI